MEVSPSLSSMLSYATVRHIFLQSIWHTVAHSELTKPGFMCVWEKDQLVECHWEFLPLSRLIVTNPGNLRIADHSDGERVRTYPSREPRAGENLGALSGVVQELESHSFSCLDCSEWYRAMFWNGIKIRYFDDV